VSALDESNFSSLAIRVNQGGKAVGPAGFMAEPSVMRQSRVLDHRQISAAAAASV